MTPDNLVYSFLAKFICVKIRNLSSLKAFRKIERSTGTFFFIFTQVIPSTKLDFVPYLFPISLRVPGLSHKFAQELNQIGANCHLANLPANVLAEQKNSVAVQFKQNNCFAMMHDTISTGLLRKI